MAYLIPFSEESMAKGSVPVPSLDFTRGTCKLRKRSFALQNA